MSRKHPRLSEEQRKEVVTRYQDLDRMENIAKSMNVTRQCIFKILKNAGVDTTKAFRVETVCRVCGKTILRHRCRARKNSSNYCSEKCYREYLHTLGETYNPSSYHSRMAREIIQKYFPYSPEEGHIIHHINKDCTDNRKINLMVFSSQSDHLRFHRGFQITPLWSGASS